jgi:uncharacterized protein
MAELARPGRDPREEFHAFAFAEGIVKMEDVRRGMDASRHSHQRDGLRCFVDIGVHQDGLVHVSQLANRFVKNPSDVVRCTSR